MLTEPDIMLYVPGQCLILVEAKFMSGNTKGQTGGKNDGGTQQFLHHSALINSTSNTSVPYGALWPT